MSHALLFSYKADSTDCHQLCIDYACVSLLHNNIKELSEHHFDLNGG